MQDAQIGPYRVVRLLGKGGMGAVYEAIQEPIERRVAIKILLPEFARQNEALQRFFNEARAVNRIEHPSIVLVSDYGQTQDGTAYLVMECLRGETLSGRLEHRQAAEGRLSVTESLQIAEQIADALAAAHEKGIVHRDLKPANVMLVRDPVAAGGERAKILDFGIAKLMQDHTKGTAPNALMGTPLYMSPEQCRGAAHVDDRTDVYALGVMLYEMLAGRPPFLADNTVGFITQHVLDEPPPLRSLASWVPVEVAALVHKLLTKDKSGRPAMAEVGSALKQLAAQQGVGSTVAPLPTPPPASPSEPAAPLRRVTEPLGATPLIPASTLEHTSGESQLRGHSTRRYLLLLGAGGLPLLLLLLALTLGLHIGTRPPTQPAPVTPLPQTEPETPPRPAAAPVEVHEAPRATEQAGQRPPPPEPAAEAVKPLPPKPPVNSKPETASIRVPKPQQQPAQPAAPVSRRPVEYED